MAFAQRAREGRHETDWSSSQSQPTEVTSTEMRRLPPTAALRAIATELQPLNRSVMNLTSLIDRIGTNTDTFDLRHDIESLTRRTAVELEKVDIMLKVLRSRRDIQRAQMQLVESSFDRISTAFDRQKQLAQVRVRQYEPVNEPSYAAGPNRRLSAWDTEQVQQSVRGFDSGNGTSKRQQQETHPEDIITELKGFSLVDAEIVQERNEAATHILHQARDLNQAYQDLAILVDEQSDQIDKADENVDAAKDSVQGGNKHLEKAMNYQASARKKMCFILVAMVVILAIIAVPTVLHVLKRS